MSHSGYLAGGNGSACNPGKQTQHKFTLNTVINMCDKIVARADPTETVTQIWAVCFLALASLRIS